MKVKFKALMVAGLVAGTLTLSGCAATHTAISSRNLDVQTQMSDTIFLDPVPASQQVVYLQLRNTSDQQGLEVESKIRDALTARGYSVTNDLDSAHYLVQANILKIGETDLRGAQGALNAGYGAGLTGAVVGGTMVGGGSGRVGTALAGGLIGMAANALVSDTHFTMITDLQISERARPGVQVSERNQATLAQGNSGNRVVTSNSESDWHRYQTRIVSTANQVNLRFERAAPELEEGLAGAIAGMF